MPKRPETKQNSKRRAGLVPNVPARLLSKSDSEDYWASSANDSIKEFNDFASVLPTRYGWRFRTKEAFEEELRELTSIDLSPIGVNKLYWEDTLKNLEAFTVMSVWRMAELLRSSVSSLSVEDTIPSAVIARAAVESVSQFLDVSRKVSPTLDAVQKRDFRKEILQSTELEELILKSVFSSKLPDSETLYNPTNILTILTRIAKTPGQNDLLTRYGILCEVTHPNFLGRSVYVTEVQAGKRTGDELRILSQEHGPTSDVLINICLWAISWSAATQVSSAYLMQSGIGSVTRKMNSTLQ